MRWLLVAPWWLAACGEVSREDGSDAGDCADGAECEPNDACGDANGPYADFAVIDGTFAPETDFDWFEFVRSTTGPLDVATIDVSGDLCGATSARGSDTELAIYGPDCTTRIADAKDVGDSFCASLSIEVEGEASVYVRVSAFDVGTDDRYSLQLSP